MKLVNKETLEKLRIISRKMSRVHLGTEESIYRELVERLVKIKTNELFQNA